VRQPGDAVVAQARIPIDRPPFNSCAGGGLKSGVGVRHSVEHTTDSERAVSHPSVSPGTEGRLSKDEYDARLDGALSARTYADLDQVVTDLPVAPATVVTTAAKTTAVTPVAKTNGLAIASLACGLAQFAFGPLATIPAIVCDHMARSQIKRTEEQGAGLALADFTLGRTAAILGILSSSSAWPYPSGCTAPAHALSSQAAPGPPPRRARRGRCGRARTGSDE
jgi:Domain of unknown function (DUF4190)/Domain of unknown function (DUF1707)